MADKKDLKQDELSQEELEDQEVSELPDREAMSWLTQTWLLRSMRQSPLMSFRTVQLRMQTPNKPRLLTRAY